jgi:hypothetical protein
LAILTPKEWEPVSESGDSARIPHFQNLTDGSDPAGNPQPVEQQVGNNGDVVEILAVSAEGLRIRTKAGNIADVEWRRLAADQAGGPTSRARHGVAKQPGETPTGRLLLGFGHALTIDAAQGITPDEHINALPRGTAGVTGFTTYVAESRSRGTTWTVIAEGALYEAERHSRALGDITPITAVHLWDRAAADVSEKPYKALSIDVLKHCASGSRTRDRHLHQTQPRAGRSSA